MNVEKQADEIVSTLYSSLDTATLEQILQVGRNAEREMGDVDDPAIETSVLELNAAIERELNRRKGTE